jgi:peptide/nickel transport system substrate-binding protein
MQPWQVDSRASEALISLTLAGLMRHDTAGIPQPELLDTWQVDVSGTVLTATLKSDLRWSDNQPLTSADVVYTYELLKSLPVTSPLLDQLQLLAAVIPVTAQSVRFELVRPYAPILTLWSMPIVPAHILANQAAASLNLRTLTVGSGPFVLKQIDENGRFLLDANPNYVRGAPLLDGVTLTPQGSANTATESVEYTLIDSATPLLTTTSVYSAALTVRNEFTAVVLNMRPSTPLAELAVRRALVAATDAQSALETASLDAWRPITSVVLPSGWLNSTYVVSDTTDIQPLLYAAGWRWDDAQQQYVREGEVVTLRMLVNADAQDQVAMANILRQQWQQHGLVVELDVQPRAAYLAALAPPYAYEMAIVTLANGRSSSTYADTLLYDPDMSSLFASDALNAGPPDPRGSLNVVGMSDVQFDQASRSAQRTYVSVDRQALQPTMHDRVNLLHPMVLVGRPYRSVYWLPELQVWQGQLHLDSPWYLSDAYRWYLEPEAVP